MQVKLNSFGFGIILSFRFADLHNVVGFYHKFIVKCVEIGFSLEKNSAALFKRSKYIFVLFIFKAFN